MLNGLLKRLGGGPRQSPALVPEGSRIYAIGDIHGHDALLDHLHDMIEADAAASGSPRKVLVYLGDYVDRGPGSDRVVARLLAPPPADFERVTLMGNHEATMIAFLEDPLGNLHWLANGGDTTLEAYGVDARSFPDDAAAMAEAARRLVPPEHLRLLRGMPFSHVEGDYFFVHAGVRPGVALDVQTPEDMMWIRRRFLESKAEYGKVVVHGHTPSAEPEFRANRIGIDTGAYDTGCLTCLVLEGADRRLLQT